MAMGGMCVVTVQVFIYSGSLQVLTECPAVTKPFLGMLPASNKAVERKCADMQSDHAGQGSASPDAECKRLMLLHLLRTFHMSAILYGIVSAEMSVKLDGRYGILCETDCHDCMTSRWDA